MLNSNLSVETFCDNFNNEINIAQDYSANVSTLTTGSDLGYTRLGSNSSWRTISISDGDPNDVTDAAILNDAGALGRYQMAAFLGFHYQAKQGSDAHNNGIQAAIWDIFDPSSSPTAPNHANADKALEQAAEWYSNPRSNKSFLSDFRIVSDSSMSWTGAGDPLSEGVPGTARHGDVSGTRAAHRRMDADRFILHSGGSSSTGLGDARAVAKRLFSWDLPNRNANVPVLAPGTRTSTH